MVEKNVPAGLDGHVVMDDASSRKSGLIPYADKREFAPRTRTLLTFWFKTQDRRRL